MLRSVLYYSYSGDNFIKRGKIQTQLILCEHTTQNTITLVILVLREKHFRCTSIDFEELPAMSDMLADLVLKSKKTAELYSSIFSLCHWDMPVSVSDGMKFLCEY